MAKTGTTQGKYYDTALAKTIRASIDALAGQKSQKEVALELGYQQANILSMFKTGETKVPLDRIPALARALGLDFSYALKLWFDQQMFEETNPKLLAKMDEIRKMFATTVTGPEQKLLNAWRESAPEDIQSGFRPLPDSFQSDMKQAFGSL